MMNETCRTIEAHAPDYAHASALCTRISAMSDDALLSSANEVLSPHANAIRAKDIGALASSFPEYDLKALVDRLPPDVSSKIWNDTSMLLMLLTTVSMVPADMLRQIEGFASAMASNMSNASENHVAENLGAMLGNMFAGAADQPVPTARARKKTPQNSQQKFRQRLV